MEQRIMDSAHEKEARERQLEQEQLLAKVGEITEAMHLALVMKFI